MAELHDRLVRCFLSVFPALNEKEVRASDVTLLTNMDSLVGVTLVALIDEEFGVDMDVDGLLELGTFEAIQKYLREQSLSGLPPTNG